MQSSRPKNEQFQLLNLSDSHSLSDLEFPEVQKKRKRRKTRSRTPGSGGAPESRTKDIIRCRNVGLWTALAAISGWLFLISYILSMIHVGFRRIEVEIEKVSATSERFPETLQKWHETSKILEQNQTNISLTLAALQDSMNKFNTEINLLQKRIEQKNEDSQETQLKGLQESVAQLGSKIEDFGGRIEKLEQEYEQIRGSQGSINATVVDIQKQIRDSTPKTTVADNTTRQHLDDVTKELKAQITNLSTNISAETPELKAKLGFLQKDLTEQKTQINNLLDQTLNISSHVSSIENLYTTKLSSQLADLEGRTSNLSVVFSQAQTQCLVYVSQYESLAREMKDLRKQVQQNMQQTSTSKPVAVPASANMFPLPAHKVEEEPSPSSNKPVISQNTNSTSSDKRGDGGSSDKTPAAPTPK